MKAYKELTLDGRNAVSEWFPRAMRRDATRQLHAKLGSAAAAPVHILCIGDSNTEGDSVSKDVNRSFTWWSELQRMLRTQFDPNGADDNASYFPVHFGSAGGGGTPSGYISGWASTGTVTNLDTLATASGMGLRANSFATSANFMTFTGVGTDFEVWYRAGPGQGTFRIVLDGAALGTTCATARAAGGLGGRTFSTGMTGLVYGTHTVRVQPNGAVGNDTIFLEGIKVYNGGLSSGHHLWDCAHGGFRAYDFNTSPTTATFADIANTADAVAGGKAWDHIIIALGTIDAIGNSRTPAQYAADLSTMIANFNAAGYTGGYTLVFPPRCGIAGSTQVTQAVMDGLRVGSQSVAQANAKVDFLDLGEPMGVLSGTDVAPLAITGSDNVHYNDRGAAWVARIVGEAIMPKRGHVLSGYKVGNLAAANDPRLSQIGVRACTTASITLSGTQTVDGVALGVDDLCLVLGQGFNSTNGVYQVKSGAWVRPAHVPAGMLMPTGWTVQVAQGLANAGQWTCSNGSPAVVGTNIMFFQRLGLDPNEMLFSAKACAITAITLSGTQTVDGIALVSGDTCLVTAQGTLATNGLWTVQSGAWSRPAAAPAGATLPTGYMVSVGLGTGFGLWVSTNGTPIIVDTTSQFFGRPSVPATSIVGVKAPTITAKATDFATTLPMPQTLLSGTFTATATSHLCEVQTDGAVAGFADGNLGLVFGVAGSPGGTLRSAGQYWPLISGATYKPIGKAGISAFGGSVSRRIWLTGLTIGTVYTWKLEATIVGGYTSVDLTPDSPTAICLSADQLRAYTVCYTSGKVYELLLGGRPGWEYRQEAWSIGRGWTVSLGASITGIGCTPTSERLVVMQYDGGGSRTLILDAVTGATLFTTACPAGATQPYSVVMRSDTEAWISCGSGHIYVVNPSTGANVGAAVLVDATGCRGICLSGDNATVYTATANGKIAKYPTAGGSVTAVATGSSVGWAVAWGGDRVWCSTDTNKAVRSHNASTLAVIDTIDFTASPMSGHGVPLYIALTSDWKLLSVVTSTGYWDYFSTDKSGSDYPANSIFDYPNISTYGGGILHTSDSYILATAGTKLNYWPGATYQCRVQGGDGAGGITAEFYNEYAEVAFS